jgi:hypothetical protein
MRLRPILRRVAIGAATLVVVWRAVFLGSRVLPGDAARGRRGAKRPGSVCYRGLTPCNVARIAAPAFSWRPALSQSLS